MRAQAAEFVSAECLAAYRQRKVDFSAKLLKNSTSFFTVCRAYFCKKNLSNGFFFLSLQNHFKD